MFRIVGVSLLTVITGVYSQCDVLLPNANAYCISPTQFTVEPPGCNATLFSCPDGSLCTDVNTICSVEGPAACRLSRACNSCPRNALSTCITDKMYVDCIGGKMGTNKKYCRASAPFCSMEQNEEGYIAVVCTAEKKDIACNGCSTFPPVTEPPPTEPPTPTPTAPGCRPPMEECGNRGKFKFTVDITGNKNICEFDKCNGAEKELNLGVSVSMRVRKADRN